MLAAVELDGLLGDIVFLAITIAFFALAWLVVRLCERIAGAEEASSVVDLDEAARDHAHAA